MNKENETQAIFFLLCRAYVYPYADMASLRRLRLCFIFDGWWIYIHTHFVYPLFLRVRCWTAFYCQVLENKVESNKIVHLYILHIHNPDKHQRLKLNTKFTSAIKLQLANHWWSSHEDKGEQWDRTSPIRAGWEGEQGCRGFLMALGRLQSGPHCLRSHHSW